MLPKEELDSRVLVRLQTDVDAARTILDWYTALAPCCRMFNDSILDRFRMSAILMDYDQDVVREGSYIWRCRKCNRVVLDES